MSDPPPITLEEPYRIDPDRQCGVLQPNGKPCTVRLSCRIHTDKEKIAVTRSKAYKQLLRSQPDSLALKRQPKQSLTLTTLSELGRLAPVFDPDVHCGVGLPSGLPCTSSILACKDHSTSQMSPIQGRNASVEELRRVHQANYEAPPLRSKAGTFDPDIHCGVNVVGKDVPCVSNLSCQRHGIKLRRAVQRKESFHNRLDLLRKLQFSALPALELHSVEQTSEVASLPPLDTDTRCGVKRGGASATHRGACANALNCRYHTTGSKQGVQRNADFDVLLRAQSPMSAITDINCGVLLPDGDLCRNDFNCHRHSELQKSNVLRHIPWVTMKMEVQRFATYGDAAALDDYDTRMNNTVRRYRRTNLSAASTVDDRADGDCIEENVHDAAVQNLNRLRQFLYEPIAETPSRSIDRLLPPHKVRRLYNLGHSLPSTFAHIDGIYHFAYAVDPELLNLDAMHTFTNGRTLHACVISASKVHFALDDTKAQAISSRLEDLLERLPIDLHSMSNGLKDWMLHSVIFESNFPVTEASTKIPFIFGTAIVDGEKYIRLDIKLHGTHAESWEHETYTAPILIPFQREIQRVPMPQTVNTQAFDFKGLEVGKKWESVPMKEDDQQYFIDMASYIVATTHLVPMERANLHYLVGTTFSQMFKLRFKVQLSDKPHISGDIASFDPATGRVSASHSLDLPDIYTIPSEQACRLLMQCIKNRFFLTKDWLATWADASNMAEMHVRFPEELIQSSCSCSQIESRSEIHMCFMCSTPTVCSGLLRQLFRDLDSATDKLSPSATTDSLDAIQLIDDRWQNKSNEAGQLLNTYMQSLIAASDDSDATARGLYKETALARNAMALQPIAEDANTTWQLWCAEGHLTPFADMLYSQIVSEVPCFNCDSISRSFEHTFVKYLNFPLSETKDEFTLVEILDTFYLEWISDGFVCENDRSHTKSFMSHRRICKGAEYICFAMARGVEGDMQITKNVVLPDQIDLGKYMDTQRLPSNTLENVQGRTLAPIKEEKYDLVAVSNWHGGHYIGYVLVDGSWVMFNDLHSRTSNKSAAQGWAEGELVHYGIYKRCRQPEVASAEATADVRHGDDQDDPVDDQDASGAQKDTEMIDDDDGSGGATFDDDPETMGAQRSPATPTRATGMPFKTGPPGRTPIAPTPSPFTPRKTSGTGSPGHTSTAQTPSPLTPRRRPRPLSSEINSKRLTSKSSRGSLHGDVSAARHDDELKAKETELQERIANQEAREVELKAREARLIDQEAREAAVKVREAQIAADQEAYEQRLQALQRSERASEQENTRLHELESRADALEQENTRLRERGSRADALEHALDSARQQRDSIAQSIRDLRASLNTRAASHRDEMRGITMQIDTANAQIEALQSSVEGLRLQRDSVVARYQVEKAQTEAEISALQEGIMALLD